jgi:hypothetical protein
MRIAFFAMAFFLSGCGTGSGPTTVNFTAPGGMVQLADALSEAARLPPLRASSEPGLRVWVLPFLGNIDGYIVSGHKAMRCDVRSAAGPGGTITVSGSTCTPIVLSSEEREALWKLMPDLRTLNGQHWGCALGGYTLIVEGVTAGQHYFFVGSNPGMCSDLRSQLVGELMKNLIPLRRDAT